MIFALLSLLTVAAAIRVTSPTSGSVWDSSASSQTISWEAVSSDPNNFVIQLVNQAGFLPNSPVTISNSQSSQTGTQSATITYPGGTWPVGTAFQINLVTSTAGNQAILAQSPQFNISNTGAAVQTSSGVSPMTLSQTATTSFAPVSPPSSTGVTVTSTTAGDASGGIPNAATSSRAAATDKASPSALISLLLTGAAFFGVFA